jgi:hypothetical protein
MNVFYKQARARSRAFAPLSVVGFSLAACVEPLPDGGGAAGSGPAAHAGTGGQAAGTGGHEAGTGGQAGAAGSENAGEAGAGGSNGAAGEAGAGGSGGAGGEAGVGGAAGAGGGCGGLEDVVLGKYTLALTNEVKTCSEITFECTTHTETGPASFEIVADLVLPDTTIALRSELHAPTLFLDGSDQHDEYDTPTVYYPSDDTYGPWDPARRATETWVRLIGFTNCPYDPSYPTTIEVDVELATGAITRVYRRCLNIGEFATIYYDVTTTGTGALVCQP